MEGMDCGGVVEKQGEKRTSGFRMPERCPRCNSSNTKFCYYNNYSHTQPRHFCKTCRRYWTKGGALRNVPVGGGCRKTKKSNTNEANASSSSPKGSFNDMVEAKSGGILNGNIDQLSSHQTLPASNALELHNGFSSSPSIDSHVVGGFPKLQPNSLNRFPTYNDVSSSSLHFNGANSIHDVRGYSIGFMGSQRNSLQSGMASSIESLSAMNANLHLKLQQKRLAMLQTEGSSHHNALDAMGVMLQPQYELDLRNQQQIRGLRDPNSLRKNIDGICSFSSSQGTISVVDRGDQARESTHEWNFDENSWPDLQQYSSLP